MKLAELSHRLERFDDAEVQLAAAAKLAEQGRGESRRPRARVKNDRRPAGSPRGSRRCAEELQGDRGKTAERLVASRPLSRGRRQAPRGGPRRRPRHAGRAAIGAGLDAGRPPARVGGQPGRRRRLPSGGSPRSTARNRTEYLTGIARLESRLGRVDAALKAGRDLLAAAPGNPEHYEFFAQLCFQLGRSEEGLDALRTRRARQSQRHQDHPDPGRDPRRHVPHRGGDRDVLAGLRQGRRPRRQARRRQPADRAVPPAQPVRPPA